MNAPFTSLADLDRNGTYTYDQYLTWRLDERVELIRGKIFPMSPSPALYHQRVSYNLSGLLYSATRGNPCKAFSAPTDVRLITQSDSREEITTVVQPDLFVVCDPSKLDERGCLGSPDFIVEILSPSTRTKDLNEKFDLYEETGVREYWVVFPTDRVIQCWILRDGVYQKSGNYTDQGKIPIQSLGGVELDLAAIFES